MRIPAIFFLAALLLNGGQADDVIRGLLKQPAPAPPAGLPGAEIPKEPRFGSPQFAAPAEDAPLEVLSGYWVEQRRGGEPSSKVRARLLEYCEKNPAAMPSLLRWLPENDAAYARVKAIYDRLPAGETDYSAKSVREYLKTRSNYFRDELIADARAAKDDEQGSVAYGPSLEALAKLDWVQAEPILRGFAGIRGSRVSVLAECLLYQHSAAESEREVLKGIVSDVKVPALSRMKALETLTQSQWEGRNDWFLSVLRDPTLRETKDGIFTVTPIQIVLNTDQDHWIALLSRAIGGSEVSVRDGAVACLLRLADRPTRKDAVAPMLPWLSDPKWCSLTWRGQLIHAVAALDMKEAIPGLIAVLSQENINVWERDAAAEALAHFRDGRAVPALRLALSKETSSRRQWNIVGALADCGGLEPKESAAAVETYTRFMMTPEGRAKWQQHQGNFQGITGVPQDVLMGGYLAQFGGDDATAELLLARIEKLKGADASVAARLTAEIAKWQCPAMARAALQRLHDHSISTDDLSAMLERREWFAKTAEGELKKLEGEAGLPGGIAALLLADKEKEQKILELGDDREAVAGLLAGARILREKLPLDAISKITCERVSLLGAAIDEYLEAYDSPVAREGYWARHKGEARIIGARQSYFPPGSSLESFDREEEKLRREVIAAKNGEEILALLSSGYWGGVGQIIIRRSKAGLEITYVEDPARSYSRRLTEDEWRRLQGFVRDERIDELGPLNLPVFDAGLFEYVHLTQDRGRRVYMNAPGMDGSGGSAYDKMCKLFNELADSGHFALRYEQASKIKGFETLFAASEYRAETVWKEGSDIRVLIDSGLAMHSSARAGNGKWNPVSGASPRPGQMHEWFTPAGGELKPTEAPPLFSGDDSNEVVPKEIEKRGGRGYRAIEWEGKKGLWEFAKGEKPKLVVEGVFRAPLITSDGEWAFLAAATSDGKSTMQRVNLKTKESSAVVIPLADQLLPVAYVAERKAVLVVRLRWPGPKKDFWLVNVASGEAKPAEGEFSPLEAQGGRPLQATGKTGEVWAAVYREIEDATEIGIYRPADFSFRKRLSIPGMQFDSQQMWIEEAAHTAYVAYHGQVVKFDI